MNRHVLVLNTVCGVSFLVEKTGNMRNNSTNNNDSFH